MTGDCPNIDSGYFVGASGKQPEIGMCQVHFIKNESIVPAVIEIEKRHGAKQFPLPAKRQNAVWVESEISFKIRFRDLNSGDHPVAHISER